MWSKRFMAYKKLLIKHKFQPLFIDIKLSFPCYHTLYVFVEFTIFSAGWYMHAVVLLPWKLYWHQSSYISQNTSRYMMRVDFGFMQPTLSTKHVDCMCCHVSNDTHCDTNIIFKYAKFCFGKPLILCDLYLVACIVAIFLKFVA